LKVVIKIKQTNKNVTLGKKINSLILKIGNRKVTILMLSREKIFKI
jgi:hypothetical protein